MDSRFALVIVATQRARQLLKDAEPLVESKNKECVTALREIAAGKVGFNEDLEDILKGNVSHERRTRRRR